MGNVNPFSQIQQLTPRNTNIVDAVAETRRITDAALRSNPLRNAIIDDGLMKWRGNYSGGPLAGTYLWIGEFTPRDNVLDKQQRGFILSRDDPKKARALWMYDPYASTSNPVNQPLRQLLSMHDADDNPIMREGRSGGTAFPWANIPMYPQVSDFLGVEVWNGSIYQGINVPIMGAINGIRAGEVRELYRGFGPMVGTKLKVQGTGNTTGPSYGIHIEVMFPGHATYVSNRLDSAAFSYWNFDIDFSSYDVTGQIVEVAVYGSGISAIPFGEFTYVYMRECRSYSP